jgi:glycosyltransferase involved in cell wall biosynthesis
VLRDGFSYRLAWRRLSAMIVNSAAMRAALLDATPWLESVPIHVVHNGVDTERFTPLPGLRAAMRTELGIAPDAFVVAFAGILQPRKRVDLLVRAAAQARVHLLLIGDGPDRTALDALARELGVAATFTGHRTDLARLLAAADAAAHLSAAEGFSNSVLECLACGLPVVATDEHSHPEQVDDGVSGVLVRPDAAAVAGALERLRRDPDERARLARAARETAVRRFGIDAMVRGYLAVFEGVLAG